jgi:hypothetical protein
MKTPYVYFDNRETLPSWFIKILRFIPESQTVFVLTNSTKSAKIANKTNIKFIKLLELDYQHEYAKFTKIYKHLSTHSESFELACFERYFALKACMSKMKLESAWQLDTDVVPTNSLNIYSKFELIFSTPYKDLSVVSAHTAKFSKAGIENLVSYLLNIFYQQNTNELERIYIERVSKGLLGGITDMTAVGYWLRTLKSGSWYNSFGNEYLGMRINHVFGNLEHDLSLASNGYTKSLVLIHLMPSVVILKTPNKTLHYANMHFQGHYKNLIPILIDLKFLIGNSKVFLSLTKVLAKIKITINI